MRIARAIFTVCVLAPRPIMAQVPDGGARPILTDVAYVGGGGLDQMLDLYIPPHSTFPTVLFIHGGSLKESGERRDSPMYRGVCPALMDAGIGCATMDYRLAPTHQWPAMPRDVASAVAWLRVKVGRHGGDPDRLFLFGHSSGCHLAAIVATDSSYLAAEGLRPRDLRGVIPMGCTLNPEDTTGRGLRPDEVREAFARDRSWTQIYSTADQLIARNPSLHVGPHVPPMLVVVAEHERFFPPILEQGARFVRLLKELDRPADIVIVPGTHKSSIAEIAEPGSATLAAVRAFVEGFAVRTGG